jgi:hypothetical protein
VASRGARAELTAEQIVRAFKRVRTPAMSSGSSPEALEKFTRELSVGLAKRNALALELAIRFPTHPRVPELMWVRWANRTNFSHETAEVVRETEAAIAGSESAALRDTARVARAMAGLAMPEIDPARRTAWVLEAANAKNPAVDAAPDLLEELATRFEVEPEAQRRLLVLAARGSRESRSAAGSWLALSAKVGKPMVGVLEELPDGKGACEEAKGKFLLVHLASVTRDEERPDIVGIAELRRGSAGANLAVVTVEAWSDPVHAAEARSRARAARIDWPFLVDTRDFGATLSSKLGIRGTPTFLLFDRDGRLAAFSTRFAAIRERYLAMAGEAR